MQYISPGTGKNSDFSKMPYAAHEYMDMRGVVDFGNLAQFAPYESGYCFLAVINGPHCMAWNKNDVEGNGKFMSDLQDSFISILENEFKGLDGIEDITTETMETTDNISTMSLISKSVQNTNSQISMRFTEKTGSVLTKYISTFIRTIKDTRTEAKTYGGLVTTDWLDAGNDPGPRHEVFNMLYVVTDATCLRIEKAFLILNAQPTSAPFSDLYTAEKGTIEAKEVTVQFNAFVVDGNIANKLASAYMRTLVNTTDNWQENKINVNSWNFNWSFADGTGDIHKVGDLNVDSNNRKLSLDGDVDTSSFTRQAGM